MDKKDKLNRLVSLAGEGRQPSGLVASSAERVPKIFLLFIIISILGFGLINRDPWRGPDLFGSAIINLCVDAFSKHNHMACIVPNINGVIVNGEFPLFFLIASSVIYWLDCFYQLLFQNNMPVTYFDDLSRILQNLFVVSGLFFLFRGTKKLALRRESKPMDPLGIGPDAQIFSSNLAACSVLLALSCLGMVSRWHEVGSDGLSFFLQTVCFFALCQSPEKPNESAVVFSLGLFGLMAGTSLHISMSYFITCIFIFFHIYPWTLVRKTFLLQVIGYLILLSLTTYLLAFSKHEQILIEWISGQLQIFEFRPLFILKTWLWTWWPVWPVCLMIFINVAKFKNFNQPHLKFLLTLFIVQSLFPLFGLLFERGTVFVPLIPLAVIGAFGLLFLPKTLANLIDWFALTIFTFLITIIWLYWIGLHTGIPANIYQNILKAAPGVVTDLNTNQFLVGVIVTCCWVYLILWRLKFVEPNIWRPVVLSAGGLAASWALLISLWGSALNINRGYHDIKLFIGNSKPSIGISSTLCIFKDDLKLSAIIASYTNLTPLGISELSYASRTCQYFLTRGKQHQNAVSDVKNWKAIDTIFRKPDTRRREPYTIFMKN